MSALRTDETHSSAWSCSSMPSMRLRKTWTILPFTRFGGSISRVTPSLPVNRCNEAPGSLHHQLGHNNIIDRFMTRQVS